MKKLLFYIISIFILTLGWSESTRPFFSDSIVVYNNIRVSRNILLLDEFWDTDDTTNNIGSCKSPFDTLFIRVIGFKQGDGTCNYFNIDSLIQNSVHWCGFFHIDGRIGSWRPLNNMKVSISARDSIEYSLNSDTLDSFIIEDTITSSDTISSLTNDLLINAYCIGNNEVLSASPTLFWMNLSAEIFPIYGSFSSRTGLTTYYDLLKYMNGYIYSAPILYKYYYKGLASYQCSFSHIGVDYKDYNGLNFYKVSIPDSTNGNNFRNVGELLRWNGNGWSTIWSYNIYGNRIRESLVSDTTATIENGIFYLFVPQRYLKSYIGYSECGGVRCHQIVPLLPWLFY